MLEKFLTLLKHMIPVFLFGFLFIGLTFLNGKVVHDIQDGNISLKKIYNETVKQVPKEKIANLISIEKNLTDFKIRKESLTIYEVFVFLEFISPSSNRAEDLKIELSDNTFTYFSREFSNHLKLINTLEDLQSKGVIKDLKTGDINSSIVDGGLKTMYVTSVDYFPEKIREFLSGKIEGYEYINMKKDIDLLIKKY